MCRAKTEEGEEGRRCNCDTSEARRLRRYNNSAKKDFSTKVISPVEPKTKPVNSSEIPRTIEEIQEIIQSSKKLGIIANITRKAGKPAELYEDALKKIGAGIEYIAEQKYNAPTDKQFRDVWDRYDDEAAEYAKNSIRSGKSEDEAWGEVQEIFDPKAAAEFKTLFEKRNDGICKALTEAGVVFANPDTLVLSPKSDEKAYNSLKKAIKFFPQKWVDESNLHHETQRPLLVTMKTTRAHYAHVDTDWDGERISELIVNSDDLVLVGEDDGMRVAIHEFSHRVESTVSGITRIEGFFLDRRAGLYPADGSVSPEELTIVHKAENIFEEDEMAYKDNFPTHYMGKVYEHNTREILSMGMETLFAGYNGGFAGILDNKADPDYKHFILGILASTTSIDPQH